jgi:hypothetical protein
MWTFSPCVKASGWRAQVDGIWNLVLSCQAYELRGEGRIRQEFHPLRLLERLQTMSF